MVQETNNAFHLGLPSRQQLEYFLLFPSKIVDKLYIATVPQS